MSSHEIRAEVCNSHCGRFSFLVESKQGQQQYYYALKLNQANQIEKAEYQNEIVNQNLKRVPYIRCYDKFIYQGSDKLYLFQWKDGITMNTLIQQTPKIKREYFSERQIRIFLAQLLEAIYQLHKNQILGRVFSTTNIIISGGNIHLMDFGFGPEFQIDGQLILASPEIVTVLQQRSVPSATDIGLDYDIKVDVWLLGAILYHLIKLRQLTSVVYPNYEAYFQEQQLLQSQENSPIHRNCSTTKVYDPKLMDLTEKLLAYNPQDRYSFSAIYKHEYIKSMNLAKQFEYEAFYNIIEQDQLFFSIKISQRDGCIDIDTRYLNLPNNSTPLDNSDMLPQIEQQFDHNNSLYQTSRFCSIWEHINLEQYRCYLLKDTARQSELQNPHFPFRFLTSYSLQRMCLLIRSELLILLDSEQPPWDVDEKLWQDFKQHATYSLLIFDLKNAQTQDKNNLQLIHQEHCQEFIYNLNIRESIRKLLLLDQERQFNFEFSSISFKETYRAILSQIFYFLTMEDYHRQQMAINLLLKITFCHLINRLFNFQPKKSDFIEIMTGSEEQNYISYRQINQYISDCSFPENKKSAIKQINHLLRKYFSNQE